MTEQTTAVVERKTSIPIVDGVMKPENFESMWRIASIYADSGLVPKQYDKNPAAIIVAGQFGAELGLSLLASLQNIAVINGNPSLWGDSMPAVVRNSQTMEVFVEYYSGRPFDDDYTAVCIAKRAGVGFGEYNPEDDLETMRRKGFFVNEYSVADAKKAGLWGGKGKEQWQKEQSPWFTNPKRMLKMRARSFTLRDGWPDKLKGMRSAEEMIDATDIIDVSSKRVERQQITAENNTALPQYVSPMIDDSELLERFKKEVEALPDHAMFRDWFKKVADANEKQFEEMALMTMRQNELDQCIKSFRAWAAKNPPKPEAKEQTADEPRATGNPDNGADAAGTQTAPAWDPLTAEVQSRYGADKAAILKAAAEQLGIDCKGKLPKDIHTALIMASQGVTEKDVAEMRGERPTQVPCGPDSSGNDIDLSLLEKYNRAQAMSAKAAKDYADQMAYVKPALNGKQHPKNNAQMAKWLLFFSKWHLNMGLADPLADEEPEAPEEQSENGDDSPFDDEKF